MPSEPTAWLQIVWAFSHSQGNSREQEPCMGMVIVRKRTNNSYTCWVLLLLTASSMVTELLAKSFVVEMHRGILVFPVFFILCSLGVFLGTLFCPHPEQRIHGQFEDAPLLMGFLLAEEEDTATE